MAKTNKRTIGKAFYVAFGTRPSPFKKGEVIKFTSHAHAIVIDDNPKDKWYCKILRFFGFKIFNPEGHIRVQFIILCVNSK